MNADKRKKRLFTMGAVCPKSAMGRSSATCMDTIYIQDAKGIGLSGIDLWIDPIHGVYARRKAAAAHDHGLKSAYIAAGKCRRVRTRTAGTSRTSRAYRIRQAAARRSALAARQRIDHSRRLGYPTCALAAAYSKARGSHKSAPVRHHAAFAAGPIVGMILRH